MLKVIGGDEVWSCKRKMLIIHCGLLATNLELLAQQSSPSKLFPKWGTVEATICRAYKLMFLSPFFHLASCARRGGQLKFGYRGKKSTKSGRTTFLFQNKKHMASKPSVMWDLQHLSFSFNFITPRWWILVCPASFTLWWNPLVSSLTSTHPECRQMTKRPRCSTRRSYLQYLRHRCQTSTQPTRMWHGIWPCAKR